MGEGWAPEVYAQFAGDRTAPFEDLLALLTPCPGGTVLDLGCGTGALTARAHLALKAARTLGLDSSAAMLNAGAAVPGVTLEQADLEAALPAGRFARVLSNSAFNWLPQHAALLPRVLACVEDGGELGVQMPSNPDSAFSRCAVQVAADFSGALGGYVYRSPVEPPEVYAELLARHPRVAKSRVGAWFYPQLHASVEGVVAFAQGGLLSAYRSRLSAEVFERFTEAYRVALRAALGDGPVFFPFRRIFLFARLR